MAWYDPRTWFKKPEPKPTPTQPPTVERVPFAESKLAKAIAAKGKATIETSPLTGQKIVKFTGGRRAAPLPTTPIPPKEITEEPTPTPKPLAIGPAPPPRADIKPWSPVTEWKPTFWEATGMSLRALGKTLTGGGIEEAKGIADPWRMREPVKGEVTTYYEGPSGRKVSAEHLTKWQKSLLVSEEFKPVTYGKLYEIGEEKIGAIQKEYKEKIMKEAEPVVAESVSYYQRLIDLGKMDVGEAQEKLDIKLGTYFESIGEGYQPEFEAKVKGIYEKYPTLTEVKGRVGGISKLGTVSDILGFTAAGIPYGIGKGAYLTATGAEKEVSPVGFAGRVTTPSEFAPTKGVYKPITQMEFKRAPESYWGMAYTGFGVLGVPSKYKLLEKSIVAGELEALSKQPVKYGAVVFEGEKGGLQFLKGTREFGKLKEEITVAGKYVKVGEKGVMMPRGFGESRIAGELSWNILGGVKPTKFISVSEFQVGAKTGLLVGGEKLSVGLSKTVFEPIVSTSAYFKHPSTMREAGKMGKLLGKQLARLQFGGVTEISYDIQIAKKVGKDLYLGAVPRGGGKIAELGLTKYIKVVSGDSGVTIFRGAGKKTPFAKTFQEVTPTFRAPIIKTSTLTRGLEQQTKAATRTIVGGRGVTAQVLKTAVKTKAVVIPSVTTLSLAKTRLGTGLITRTGLLPKVGLAQYPKLRIGLTQASAPSIKQMMKPALRTSFAPSFITPTISVHPPKIPFRGFPIIPFIPPFGLGRGRRKKATQLRKQPTKYQPSFTALALGIKAPKIPKAYYRGAGGLIIRPILISKPKKKVKKKAKKKKRRKKVNGKK